MPESKIELADVIRQLRAELQKAMEEGEDEGLRFRVADLELELQVAVTKSAEATARAGGGLKFWIFNAEAGAEGKGAVESERIQTLRLKLDPKQIHEDGEVDDEPVFLSAGD